MRRLSLAITVLLVPLVALFAVRRPATVAKRPAERELAVGQVLGAAPEAGFLRAGAPRTFRFPADHGPHPGYRNEWWYFTGNLADAGGRRFGYQLTFFRVALTPKPPQRASQWAASEIYMAHFALTDVAGRRFRCAERFSRAALGLAGAGGNPLTVRLEDWSATETSPHPWAVRLSALDGDTAIDLDLRSLTPEVLNGEGGLSRKGSRPGDASYYYSVPRLATGGTVRVGGQTYRVAGSSWLDREWSTSALEPGQVGWDWFALQLDDGRDLMFYRLRRSDGSTDPHSGGTLVAADGKAQPLRLEDVQLESTRWWKSQKSGARYPTNWRLRVPSRGVELEISPRLDDQELAGSFRYWEGAVAVRGLNGSPSGAGYLELTGYPPPQIRRP